MGKTKILLLGTNTMSIYNHRFELIRELISQNFDVLVSAPYGEEVKELEKMGVEFIDTPVDTRGTNILRDILLLNNLIKIIKSERPDIVLTFYTKTNIYGGIACRICNVPYIENITGLGTAVMGGGILQKIMIVLYQQAIKSADMVFFQNRQNMSFFKEKNIKVKDSLLLPGSGVSLERFVPLPYPKPEPIKFVFISRVLKEKGIEEYVEAAKIIKLKYPSIQFHVVGPCGEEYIEYLNDAQMSGVITYHGKQLDVKPYILESHCTVFPSYYPEGIANVLLESASSARPVITTNMPGCKETVDDKVTGFIVKERDIQDLAEKLEQFISLSDTEREIMGKNGRRKMEKEFNRKIVVDAYINKIAQIRLNKNRLQ